MFGQTGDGLLGGLLLDETDQDALPVDAEQVGEDAGVVDDLLDAVSQSVVVSNHLSAFAGDVAQFAELRQRHEAGLAESELADASQSDAVGAVGFATFDLLDVLSVENQRLNAALFQGF